MILCCAVIIFLSFFCSFDAVASYSSRRLTRDKDLPFWMKTSSVSNEMQLHQEMENNLHLRTKKDDTSSPIDHKKEVNNSLPLFILHMGPGKTGTSTIQKDLSTLKQELQKDNYSYIGNNGGPLNKGKLYSCSQEAKCGLSEKVESYLEDKRRIGINLVGSNEFLSTFGQNNTHGEDWWSMRGKWDFQIWLSYRRPFEIIPSFFNQQYKFKRDSNGNRLKGIFSSHEDWPGIKQDYRIPGFEEFFTKEDWLSRAHFVKNAYYYWQPYADAVHIFNVHQHGDLSANFVCQTMPKANFTCAKLRRRENDHNQRLLVENPSKPLDYDILAVHAYEQGLLNKTNSRKNVVKAIQHYHEKVKGLSEKDLPQRCLNSTVLYKFYHVSLDLEKWAVSTWTSTISKSSSQRVNLEPFSHEHLLDFNASWNKALEKKKLCSVDAVKVMKQKDWQEFFEKYVSTGTGTL